MTGRSLVYKVRHHIVVPLRGAQAVNVQCDLVRPKGGRGDDFCTMHTNTCSARFGDTPAHGPPVILFHAVQQRVSLGRNPTNVAGVMEDDPTANLSG